MNGTFVSQPLCSSESWRIIRDSPSSISSEGRKKFEIVRLACAGVTHTIRIDYTTKQQQQGRAVKERIRHILDKSQNSSFWDVEGVPKEPTEGLLHCDQ